MFLTNFFIWLYVAGAFAPIAARGRTEPAPAGEIDQITCNIAISYPAYGDVAPSAFFNEKSGS